MADYTSIIPLLNKVPLFQDLNEEDHKEIIDHITKGNSSSQIADRLNISLHTVNSHRKNILKKLGLKSPTELIIYAVKQGWVDLNS